MSKIKKLLTLNSLFVFIAMFLLFFSAASIPEAVHAECGDDEVQVSVNPGGNVTELKDKDNNVIGYCIPDGDDIDSNAIVFYLKAIIQFLTGGVGLVVTLMIIIGGVQYMAAGDSPQKVEAAKKRITNAILALVLFIFTVAILNFLVPGGLL